MVEGSTAKGSSESAPLSALFAEDLLVEVFVPEAPRDDRFRGRDERDWAGFEEPREGRRLPDLSAEPADDFDDEDDSAVFAGSGSGLKSFALAASMGEPQKGHSSASSSRTDASQEGQRVSMKDL